MDIYEKVKRKYQKSKILSIILMAGGCLAAVLTIVFVFVHTGPKIASFNQYHYWALGFMAVLVVTGAILFVYSSAALKDVERAVDRINPDERELSIQMTAKVKALKIYNLFIFPAEFIVASALVLTKKMDYIPWILIICTHLALIITVALIRRSENKKQ